MSEELILKFVDPKPMRYGENSHQSAVFYRDPTCTEASLATAKQLWGKELSYNNIVDADAALEMAREFADENAVVIVKHMNPCGLATGKTLRNAMEAAWEGDPVSAFGSVIAVTKKVDLKTAEFLKGKFVEILLAPAFDKDALEFLKNKSKDIRLLEVGKIKKATRCKVYKHVIGGMLVQDRDVDVYEKFECVTKKKFAKNKEALARFTWIVTKHTKSNAIVMGYEYARGYFQVIGLGPGQPNRIDSNLRLCQPRVRDNVARMKAAQKFFNEKGKCIDKAGLKALEKKVFSEVVMGSDAFFPFPDNVEAAAKAGVQYIVQPGGSKKDNLSIEACDKLGVAMVFTGMRHFRH